MPQASVTKIDHKTRWSEAEWEQLDPAERPSHAVQVAGLGWVGAVLGPNMRSSPG